MGEGAAADGVQGEMPDSVKKLSRTASGSCLCKGVTYEILGELDDIVACHCEQCRKTSGHFVAATRVKDKHLSIAGQQSLAWYASSKNAKRGFCTRCGSSLFWKNGLKDTTSIMAGTLNLPTNLKLSRHIYVADASDYVSFHEDDVLYDQND